MSEYMSKFVKDIKIKGGIHNESPHSAPRELTEEKLEALIVDLMIAIKKHTGQSSYITLEFIKTIGTKVNS